MPQEGDACWNTLAFADVASASVRSWTNEVAKTLHWLFAGGELWWKSSLFQAKTIEFICSDNELSCYGGGWTTQVWFIIDAQSGLTVKEAMTFNGSIIKEGATVDTALYDVKAGGSLTAEGGAIPLRDLYGGSLPHGSDASGQVGRDPDPFSRTCVLLPRQDTFWYNFR